ncbi:deoxyribonuclease-1 [Rhinatrema bivittatum]|uniref:deoxyribonuclease-1 n=1 Tax=Rhinatrema bivittatum TaxID=194408 RepID=UPI00112CFB24|nr:deoxyribonuclease-1 [Rhinatrema bivittatum]
MKQLFVWMSLTYLLNTAAALKIAAFNIRSFGDSKMDNPSTANFIVEIILRYDMILIQEVRDSDLSAVQKLMDHLNNVSEDSYSYEISDPLGRDSYKEQYLFIYKTEMMQITENYHYHDNHGYSGTDVFSREPYVLKVYSPISVVAEFALVPLHAAPKDALREVDALYDVYEDVIRNWGTDNILFLGDFNCDCSYLSDNDWPHVRLRNSEEFEWLIPDSADTTVTHTNCAYDRIVVSGSALQHAIVPGSAIVYDFQKEYNLSTEEALAISDHFPVEVELKCT